MHKTIDQMLSIPGADEENIVSGGVAAIPFELVIWHEYPGAYGDVRPTKRLVVAGVGDDGEGLAVHDHDVIGPIGVCLATA